MRVLDLCCGRLGWSRAFAARGWECVGVDLVQPPEIPQGFRYVKADVMRVHFGVAYSGSAVFTKRFHVWAVLAEDDLDLGYFDFICASTPCEDFSTMRNFRPPVPYPELGIKLFNHVRTVCEASGVPYIMENVAGAGKYVGRATAHCGSYYLWGTGVPPILPPPFRKGMTELAMGLREHKGKPGWDVRHGKRGQTQTALVATIPLELANCVADYAERICEPVGR